MQLDALRSSALENLTTMSQNAQVGSWVGAMPYGLDRNERVNMTEPTRERS